MIVAQTNLERWANKQTEALINIGTNAIDAHRVVREFLAMLPAGADPDTWIPSAYQLEQDVSDKKYADDAIAAWIARDDVANRDKLIIVARSEG